MMSQFLKSPGEYNSAQQTAIDFDEATKLHATGSTCDTYLTRWQRRKVFVKRLKEEFRTNPFYLDALDKEFEIGVNLKHPSLPVYHAFDRDYVIMDYIDGNTLTDMISKNDNRLTREMNIVRWLNELIAVVEYLHRHNVVHCDIKADNIMITANGSNLVLIDFDKCYTDALADTSGHPCKYGLSTDEVGRSAIDFHAIGMLVENLKKEVRGFKFRKYKLFVKTCFNREVNCGDLKYILAEAANLPQKRSLMVSGGLIAIGVLIGFIYYLAETNYKKPDEPVADVNEERNLENISNSVIDTLIINRPPIVVDEPRPLTREDIHADAKIKAEQLDKRITPYFNELQSGLNRLSAIRNDTTLTGQQLLDSIRTFGDKADEYITEAFTILDEMYPGMDGREAWRVMSYSKAYTGYTRRYAVEGKEYRREYERRFEKEGNRPQ